MDDMTDIDITLNRWREDPIVGVLRLPGLQDREFAGWMGLMAVLEEVRAARPQTAQ
jgi:hypothetical protein